MEDSQFHQELLESDDFAYYSLRSSFFFRGLRAVRLWEAIDNVTRLTEVRRGFAWKSRKRWGIDEDAWNRIEKQRIDPLLVFCHPRVLSEQPWLLLYYRTLSLISQKGLGKLVGGNIDRVESGVVDTVDEHWHGRVVVALNSLISAVIIGAAEYDERQLSGLQFAAAGATLQGGWNNRVGREGEAAVRTMLLNHLRGEIAQIVWRDGRNEEYTAARHPHVIDHVMDVKIVRLKQGFHLRFASEPDISVRNPEDVPVIAIEVKAGTDAAGALERLGAAMKSFEKDRAANPRVKTVYVVRAMTRELRTRIDESNPFDHTFGLAELLIDEEKQRRFANLVLRVVLNQA